MLKVAFIEDSPPITSQAAEQRLLLGCSSIAGCRGGGGKESVFEDVDIFLFLGADGDHFEVIVGGFLE